MAAPGLQAALANACEHKAALVVYPAFSRGTAPPKAASSGRLTSFRFAP
jgi:hypothetical protein